MDSPTTKPQRTFLQVIFLSPDERRLRAGWRLLLHSIIIVLTGTLILYAFDPLLTAIVESPGFIDPFVYTVELISILVATWIARRWFDRRSFQSLGFIVDRQAWIDLMVGFLIPALLMGMVFVVEIIFGWTTFEYWTWQNTNLQDVLSGVLLGLTTFILVGFSEEILSRGYHLQNLRDGINLSWGLFLSSGMFAFLHSANPNSSWISTLGILFAGYFLAYGWLRTGQLWLSIGLHIGWNFFEGNIFGFPVSGMTTVRLIQHNTTGPEWLTGGAFGPEAGVIILPAMALGIFLLHLYTQNRQP